MTVPVAAMLAFAVWTLFVLFGSVGVYRWSRILTGRATVNEWHADEAQGSGWYRRAMRAHMNCVENLPVFATIVIAAALSGIDQPLLDILAVVVVSARIMQSLIQIILVQTNMVALVRFAFFFLQATSMVAMAVAITIAAVR
jgi:uncharacterized MAPEG superfamily protein